MEPTGYLLDNAAREAAERFDALSRVFDGWTRRHVEAVGLGPGWRCWEVGAGGPRMPTWLASRTAPGGEVFASDVDLSWLELAGPPPPYRTVRHDVAADEPIEGGFDLVHARLVLGHVPGREEALRRMVSALRPGGWLVVEDFDMDVQPLACLAGAADEAAGARAERVRAGFMRLLVQRGVDARWGRRVAGVARQFGLVDVHCDAYMPVGLPSVAPLELANTRQVRAGLVALGIDGADIDAHLDAVERGVITLGVPPLVTTWARRAVER